MPLHVDWYYHRNGCQTCQRADAYLARRGVTVAEQVDARRHRIGPAAAIKLIRAVKHLWVARGKSCRYINLSKDSPTDAELKKLVIGPSGNLRAPTIRHGDKVFVGFHASAYDADLIA